MPMTQVAALGLPSVNDGCRFTLIDFCNRPARNAIPRNYQLHNTEIYTKLFISVSPDDLISVFINIRGRRGYDHPAFIVHSSALLRHAHVNQQNTVVWQLWGPSVTRWYSSNGMVLTNVCGQRCFGGSVGSQEIWDFNPYRVKHLGKCFAVESETASLSVETGRSCVKSWGLNSSLPYVKLVPKQWPLYLFTCLDDDRVFGVQVLEDHKVDQLYFG